MSPPGPRLRGANPRLTRRQSGSALRALRPVCPVPRWQRESYASAGLIVKSACRVPRHIITDRLSSQLSLFSWAPGPGRARAEGPTGSGSSALGEPAARVNDEVVTVLVTGATGRAGWHVARTLHDSDHRVRAAVSDRNATGPWDETVAFSFTDPGTWDAAFTGVDRMFLMRPPQIGNVIHEGAGPVKSRVLTC